MPAACSCCTISRASDLIRDRDEAADVPRVADGDGRLAVCFQRFRPFCGLGRILTALDDVTVGAEPEWFAIEGAGQSLSP
jgi:hypothetical protein